MLTKVKIERLKANVKQWELAQKAGVECSMLSKIETGRKRPSPSIKKAIAKALNKPVNFLFPNTK